MVIEALPQALMWTEHEALLNVVAQKQISAPAGNRTSLLLRVLKESIIAEVKKKKRFIPALCLAFEIGNQFFKTSYLIVQYTKAISEPFLFK